MILCQCGCGKEIKTTGKEYHYYGVAYKRSYVCKYLPGHRKKMRKGKKRVVCKKEESINYGQSDPIFTFNGVGIM